MNHGLPMSYRLILTLTATLFLLSCGTGTESESTSNQQPVNALPPAPLIAYQVLETLPHDPEAFTQGLEFINGQFFESTGLNGKSTLRKVDPVTGKVLQQVKMDNAYFGEGLCVWKDTIYQLTWQNHEVILYNKKDLKEIKKLSWNLEGWGLTRDSAHLIISDGSDKLYFVQPGTLKLSRVVSVSDHMGAMNNLNELEYINGYVYANRWQYDQILKIDPSSGRVVGIIDLTDALKKYANVTLSKTAVENGAYLNGIAYDPTQDVVYVTGKLWPSILKLKLQN
jgi:glutaminyl-peptide cyclotransferase